MHPDLEKLSAADAEDRRIKALDRAITNARTRLTDAADAVKKATAADAAARAALTRLHDEERALTRELTEYRNSRASALRILESGAGSAEVAERQRVRSEALIDEAETRALVNLEAQDPVRAAAAAAAQALVQANAVLAVAQVEVPAEITRHEAERAAHVTARDAELAPLDHELRSRYAVLTERKGSAVAHVKAGACSACNIAVFQQHVTDLQRGVIVPCRGCGRWLVP